MRTIIIYTLFVLTITTQVSCTNYLDVTPDNVATIDYAFRNRNEAENYLFTCYSTLQNGGMAEVLNNPGFVTSGEIIYPYPTLEQTLDLTGFSINHGTQNVLNPALNYWDGSNGGGALFIAIRRCNIFLENIDKPFDLSESEKIRWTGEAKFLKAYFHYWLVRMYGPIPIMKQNLPIAVSTGEVRSVRQPVDSVFNYIVQLLDEAAASLPDRINNEVEEQGRITRPIALSVKAEVLATQASPLYNGNPDYAGFSNKDGQALFSVDYDPLKWEKTVEACKEAIDACHEAGIAFYDFIPPANITHISDTTHLTLTLRNAMTDEWNSEIIWTINKEFAYQYSCVARLNAEAITNYGIHSRFAVPLGQAELYYTDNGVPIAEDKTWDYKNRYNLQQSDSAYRYYIKEGYQTVKLHFDREPRFYASVGFDGGLWFGNGTLNDNNSLYVQAKAGQPAGDAGQGRTNVTGYFPKKLVHYQSVFLTNSTTFGYYWPMMRLPGLYLLYAEALNELNGPSETVYQYIDMVRARAGLKGVVESWKEYANNPDKPGSKEGLREIIHRERRIELSFEGQAGWDLRRWKELMDVLTDPVQGWDIYQEEAQSYYRPKTVFIPTFRTKDYLWPIRDQTLAENPNLVQNPGW